MCLSELLGIDNDRMMIMPLLKRIVRCDADDLNVLKHFLSLVYDKYGPSYKPYTGSNVLQLLNIGLSEIWYGDDPRVAGPDYEILVELEDDYYVAAGYVCLLCNHLVSTRTLPFVCDIDYKQNLRPILG